METNSNPLARRYRGALLQELSYPDDEHPAILLLIEYLSLFIDDMTDAMINYRDSPYVPLLFDVLLGLHNPQYFIADETLGMFARLTAQTDAALMLMILRAAHQRVPNNIQYLWPLETLENGPTLCDIDDLLIMYPALLVWHAE